MMASSKVSISVDKLKLEQLRAVGGKAAVRRALGKIAFLVEAEAKQSMEGARSGAMYGSHQASAPGEPPAVDTGALKNSIEAKPEGDGTEYWRVNVAAEHGLYMEFGTMDAGGHVAARPFLRPAAEKGRQEMDSIIKDEFDSL